MYCENCGKKLIRGYQFCIECGTPVPPEQDEEETQAQGEFTPVELGGHHLVIKQVNEKKSSTGKDMLVVLFDFAPNDKQSGYFME